MNIPCVIVFTKDTLLNLALTKIINAAKEGVTVIESAAKQHDELVGELTMYPADILLLDKNCSAASEESLIKLLKRFPKLLVIVVNEENNWLQTYRREDILVTSPDGLMEVIKSSLN